MKTEGFTIRSDEKSNEYVTFVEEIPKTCQSGLDEKHRLTLPKIFEINSVCCPVVLDNNGSFYL